MHTTIQLKKSTLNRLQKYKQHPRESYDVVVNTLMDNTEDDLTPEEIEDLQKALEDVKQGKVKTLSEAAKELGVQL